jgi:hypothetical protein
VPFGDDFAAQESSSILAGAPNLALTPPPQLAMISGFLKTNSINRGSLATLSGFPTGFEPNPVSPQP